MSESVLRGCSAALFSVRLPKVILKSHTEKKDENHTEKEKEKKENERNVISGDMTGEGNTIFSGEGKSHTEMEVSYELSGDEKEGLSVCDWPSHIESVYLSKSSPSSASSLDSLGSVLFRDALLEEELASDCTFLTICNTDSKKNAGDAGDVHRGTVVKEKGNLFTVHDLKAIFMK